jgi:hypothetical protein
MLAGQSCWSILCTAKHHRCVIGFVQDGSFLDIKAVNGSSMLDDACSGQLQIWIGDHYSGVGAEG